MLQIYKIRTLNRIGLLNLNLIKMNIYESGCLIFLIFRELVNCEHKEVLVIQPSSPTWRFTTDPFSSSLAQSPDETPEALTGAVLPLTTSSSKWFHHTRGLTPLHLTHLQTNHRRPPEEPHIFHFLCNKILQGRLISLSYRISKSLLLKSFYAPLLAASSYLGQINRFHQINRSNTVDTVRQRTYTMRINLFYTSNIRIIEKSQSKVRRNQPQLFTVYRTSIQHISLHCYQ